MKMHIQHKHIFQGACLILLLLLALAGCKKEELDYVGPAVRPASENFAVNGGSFTASNASPIFPLAPIYFKAGFNETVSWKVVIKGHLSGAEKTFIGVSDTINNKNTLWNGDSENQYFFRKSETCTVTLMIDGHTPTYSLTVKILTVKKYDLMVQNGIHYTLIDDFDKRGIAMASVSKDQFDNQLTMALDTNVKCQEKFAFYMAGHDKNMNSWCGGINHTNLTEIHTGGKTPSTSDASELYINFSVYGTGAANTSLEIKIYEIDADSNLAKPLYTYDQLTNDAWIVQIPVNWVGWKRVSLNYADFIPAKYPTSGGNGNHIRQPNHISGMGISLLAMPEPGATVSTYIDMVYFTEYGPFLP